jgi:hypothetical protein
VAGALWHVSDDDAIRRFEPRANADHDSAEPLVWAIDDEHVPAYWFPRDCPRGTFWASEATSDDDVAWFLLGDRSLRVHAVQGDWLGTIRSAFLVAYRLPPETFERYERANGYWVSRQAVTALEAVELGDLLDRHAAAGIELRIVRDLGSLWQQVIGSTLEFSGIRLRNLQR